MTDPTDAHLHVRENIEATFRPSASSERASCGVSPAPTPRGATSRTWSHVQDQQRLRHEPELIPTAVE